MSGPTFEVTYRGVTWPAQALSAAGTKITVQFRDRRHDMPCSVLEFSLWDAACLQVPSMELSDEAIEILTPWLTNMGLKWRLQWDKRRTKPKKPEAAADPRQLKLPWG